MPARSGETTALELTVSDADTAVSLRTGDVPVLATPRLVALCEEACMEAARPNLEPGETTVAMRVQVDHVQPVAVGGTVRAEVNLERTEGRRLTYTVSVTHDGGLVAAGRITRVVVDRKRFLEKTR